MVVAHGDLLILLQGPPLNAPDGNAAHKLVVINGGHQHLERLIHIRLRRGDIINNGVKQRLQICAGHIGGIGRNALSGRAEQHRGIQLLFCGVQIQQQLQHLVHHLVDALVGPVDLVYHHDNPVAQLQGAAEDEAGLGHGPLSGVHQQDNAVNHLQNTLYLAAEIGVARSVYNVDFRVAVANGGVFGQDGNAALPLQVVGVHDPVYGLLILPIYTALLEHFVHQGGLAVVNMGNNGNISQFFVLQW